MTTTNVSNVSSTQYDFSNLAEVNQGPSSTSTYHSPPPLTRPPTPPLARICTPVSKPVIQTQQTHQDTSTDSDEIPPETVDIFDYTIWSRINFVLGAIVLGIPCIILSIVTRRYKRKGNVRLAKIWSSITLGMDIFISFILMCAMVGVITYFNGIH
jgi:hypothetical protein